MRHVYRLFFVMTLWVAFAAAQTETIPSAADLGQPCWEEKTIEDPERCLVDLRIEKKKMQARRGDRVSEARVIELKELEKWLKEKVKPVVRRQKAERFNAKEEIEVAGRVQLVCPAAAGPWSVTTVPQQEYGMLTRRVYVEPRAAEPNARGLIRSVEILLHNNTAGVVDIDSTAWGPIVRGLCPGGRLRLRISDYYLSFANQRTINFTAIKADDGKVIDGASVYFDRSNTWTPVEARIWVLR